jgi:hypothetical protein
MEYLRPIMEIERTDRDDVFRKSSKFDRPDFGNNIPFELFSALSNLHLSHKQDQEKEENDSYPHETQQIEDGTEENNDDTNEDNQDETTEGRVEYDTEREDSGQKESTEGEEPPNSDDHEEAKKLVHHDTITIDAKTVSENPQDSQERRVPAEFEVQLRHSKSIEEQVIDTKQDQDLITEKEEEKVRRKSIDKTLHEESQKDHSIINASDDHSKVESPIEKVEETPKDQTLKE